MTPQELVLGATLGLTVAAANYAGVRYFFPTAIEPDPETGRGLNIRPYLLGAFMLIAAISTIESWSHSPLLVDAVLTYEASMGTAAVYDLCRRS